MINLIEVLNLIQVINLIRVVNLIRVINLIEFINLIQVITIIQGMNLIQVINLIQLLMDFFVSSAACQRADVVLALDTTSLISPDYFYQNVVQFARTFAGSLNVKPDQTHFGLETFANVSAVQFYLSQYTNTFDLINSISPMYTGGWRNTVSAIDTMTDDMFMTSRGARSGTGTNKIGVILTYGGTSNATRTIASAMRAKDQMIKLIVVAVNVLVSYLPT